jgi:hypothetical protein
MRLTSSTQLHFFDSTSLSQFIVLPVFSIRFFFRMA